MAYEGSKADEAEDRRGMKKTGMSRGQYEKSARDKREDKAGEKRSSGKKAPTPKKKSAPPDTASFGLAPGVGGGDQMPPDDMGGLEGGM